MKNIKSYLIILISLIIVAIVMFLSRSSGTLQKSQSDFAVRDTASISKIFLADKLDNSILLEKISPGYWELNGKYKAHKEKRDLLMETIMKLEVMNPVSEAAHNTVISILAANSVKVEIYQHKPLFTIFGIDFFNKERNTKTYYVGSATQNNLGTYMLMEDAERPFVVYIPGFRGFVAARYTLIEDDWRDHTIFNTSVSHLKSIEVQNNEDPSQSFKISTNNQRSFTLYGSDFRQEIVNYDTIRLLDFISSFENIRFEGLRNDIDSTQKDSLMHSTPFRVIKITDINGNQTIAKAFRKPVRAGAVDYKGDPVPYNRDKLLVLINEGKDLTLCQYFVFDKILRPLEYFTR